MSSAWVLPSLIGPPIAGLLTDLFSWHWVFLGLIPIVAVAVALVVPAVRKLTPPTPDPAHAGRGRHLRVVVAALGAAVGVSALSWAAQHISLTAGVVALVALGLLSRRCTGCCRGGSSVPAAAFRPSWPHAA
jgi:MFS family permease